MAFVEWKLPVQAQWSRSLVLQHLQYDHGQTRLTIAESSGRQWVLRFTSAVGTRVTALAAAGTLLNHLPHSGGLFESVESSWVREAESLGLSHSLRHYVICCEQEIVEVLAAECDASPADR
jgi:hypothetical protein